MYGCTLPGGHDGPHVDERGEGRADATWTSVVPMEVTNEPGDEWTKAMDRIFERLVRESDTGRQLVLYDHAGRKVASFAEVRGEFRLLLKMTPKVPASGDEAPRVVQGLAPVPDPAPVGAIERLARVVVACAMPMRLEHLRAAWRLRTKGTISVDVSGPHEGEDACWVLSFRAPRFAFDREIGGPAGLENAFEAAACEWFLAWESAP